MRTNPVVKSITLAAAVLCAAGGAMAASSTTTSSATIAATTATSNNGNGGALATRSATVNFSAASFDSTLGVLTGVSATLSGGTLAGSGGAAGVRQATEVYTLAGSTTTPATFNVGGNGQSTSLGAQTLGSFANLAAFVTDGAGTVGSTATYTARADRTASSGSTGASVSGTATQAITYTYLQHANASFSSDSDLNALALVASSTGTAFNVFALGSADTARLDAVSFSCVSGCGAFQLNLASFGDLVAGQSVAGSVQLLATTAGTYAGQYLLSFIDDTAVGVGQKANTLTLNLSATVAAVPEPETYALLLAGLGAMGFISRRRRA